MFSDATDSYNSLQPWTKPEQKLNPLRVKSHFCLEKCSMWVPMKLFHAVGVFAILKTLKYFFIWKLTTIIKCNRILPELTLQ